MTEFTKQQIDEDLRIRAEESKRANEHIELMRQAVEQQRLTHQTLLKSIDWESRRWQAAVAAMQGLIMCDNDAHEYMPDVAEDAIRFSDLLIAEYRKQETAK